MEEILKRIIRNKKKNPLAAKKDWYKVGKRILNGEKPKIHSEQKTGARRAYKFYKIDKGNWQGPSAREFGKMTEEVFNEKLRHRNPLQDLTLDEIRGLISFEEEEGLLGLETLGSHVTGSFDFESVLGETRQGIYQVQTNITERDK